MSEPPEQLARDGGPVEALVDADQLAAIEPRWRALRETLGARLPDSDPAFFRAVTPRLPGRPTPHVLRVASADTEPGLVVARTSSERGGPLLGSFQCLEIVPEGLLITTPAEGRAVGRHLRERLAKDLGVVRLLHVESEHPAMEALLEELGAAARLIVMPEVHWTMRMWDDAADAPVERNSAKTRSTFRRKDRRLAREFDGALELRELDGPDDVETLITLASAVTRDSYQYALGAGVVDDDRWRAVAEALAAAGTLRGAVLLGGDEPIAYVVGSVYDRGYTLLATSFRESYGRLSPGLVVMNRVFALLEAERVRSVDFGFGDASYKRMYGSESTETLVVDAFSKRLSPSCLWIRRRAKSHVRAWASNRDGRLQGIARRVRRRVLLMRRGGNSGEP